jgi:hypothetical protein
MTGAKARAPRRFPPPPPEFAEEFARGGWERVELLYGARTDCIKKWIALTGAKTRRALRASDQAEPSPAA